ncbi:MAG: tRNA (adenosine(37)-N6)-dimethylallyltransferase MiaA [Christensenellales bacterium]
MNKIIVVGGATASGKSGFGVELAKKLNTEVISCDSMQIYKGLDVGTAKITAQQMQGIRHHLIDVAMPSESFSVSEWRQMAVKIIDDLHAQGKIPVIVGGTGLYIDSLLYKFSFFCNGDEQLRQRLNEQLAIEGAEKMHDILSSIDPEEAKKIHPNNTKRLLRALEIYYTTGQIKSDKQEKILNDQYDVRLVVINRDRQSLYKRIDQRVDEMFECGLAKEVADIVNNSVADFGCQSMQAIGYKEFEDYFAGKTSLEEVKETIKINSRHYAKRQISWLKRYKSAIWYDAETQYDQAMNNTLEWANE